MQCENIFRSGLFDCRNYGYIPKRGHRAVYQLNVIINQNTCKTGGVTWATDKNWKKRKVCCYRSVYFATSTFYYDRSNSPWCGSWTGFSWQKNTQISRHICKLSKSERSYEITQQLLTWMRFDIYNLSIIFICIAIRNLRNGIWLYALLINDIQAVLVLFSVTGSLRRTSWK